MGVAALFDIEYCGVHPLSNGDAEDEEQQDDTPEEVQVAASSRVH
jgi:hypothetical protein